MEDKDEKSLLDRERTRLAAERTLLSWIRTGLTSVGLGIAIAKFLVFKDPAHQVVGHRIGEFFILWGTALFPLAVLNYWYSQRELFPYFLSKRLAFNLLLCSLFFLIFLSLTLLWIVVE